MTLGPAWYWAAILVLVPAWAVTSALVPNWAVNLSFVEILEWDFSHLWEQFELWLTSGCYCSSGSILGRDFCLALSLDWNLASAPSLTITLVLAIVHVASLGLSRLWVCPLLRRLLWLGHCLDHGFGSGLVLACDFVSSHIFICNFGSSYCSRHKFAFISILGSCFGFSVISDCKLGYGLVSGCDLISVLILVRCFANSLTVDHSLGSGLDWEAITALIWAATSALVLCQSCDFGYLTIHIFVSALVPACFMTSTLAHFRLQLFASWAVISALFPVQWVVAIFEPCLQLLSIVRPWIRPRFWIRASTLLPALAPVRIMTSVPVPHWAVTSALAPFQGTSLAPGPYLAVISAPTPSWAVTSVVMPFLLHLWLLLNLRPHLWLWPLFGFLICPLLYLGLLLCL